MPTVQPSLEVQTISLSLPRTFIVALQNITFTFAFVRDVVLFIYALLTGKVTFVQSKHQLHVQSSSQEANGSAISTTTVPLRDEVKKPETNSKSETSDQKSETTSKGQEKSDDSSTNSVRISAIREFCKSIVQKDFDHVLEYANRYCLFKRILTERVYVGF